MSRLKELRYKYNMFDVSKEEDAKTIKFNKKEEQNKVLRISKEHEYELVEFSQPEETWKKKNPRKQKAIKLNQLSNAKKPKKLLSQSENVQDIINLDSENEMEIDSVLRIRKEHTYYKLNEIKELKEETQKNIKYFLLRYNTLFKKIYRSLKQSDISFYNILDIDDWNSLKKGFQLTNFVLDCAIICIIKENFKNILSLPCQINEICLEKVNKVKVNNANFIIVPILKGGHFNLCILNMLTHEFCFIDSLYNGSGQDHYDKFISFSKDKSWKFLEISSRATQKDSVSCGVFVIMYVLHYFLKKSLLNLPHPDQYRETIKSILLRNSDDLSQFCCHCGSIKKNKTKCTLSKYTVYKECSKHIYNNAFNICKMCTKNILN